MQCVCVLSKYGACMCDKNTKRQHTKVKRKCGDGVAYKYVLVRNGP